MATIFVELVDEPILTWRPVQATRLSDDVYVIDDQPYESDIETWAFLPGETVHTGLVEASSGKILAATSRVPMPLPSQIPGDPA